VFIMNAVLAPNGDIVAALSANPQGGVARWDGVAWRMLGLSGTIFSVAIAPNGDILACAENEQNVTGGRSTLVRWDGVEWKVVSPLFDKPIFSAAALPNGDIIASGNFWNLGGNPNSNGIARFDGTAWQPLGTGGGYAWDIVPLSNGEFLVGGEFMDMGGNPDADYIARWDGSAWQAIGQGPPYIVRDIALAPNGDILAGDFRWDGTSWQQLGSGLMNIEGVDVAANGDIILGGVFGVTNDGSVEMRNFAIYRANPTGTPEGVTPLTTKAWPNPARTSLQVQLPGLISRYPARRYRPHRPPPADYERRRSGDPRRC
jgi:trimeric autotransporter adhesin